MTRPPDTESSLGAVNPLRALLLGTLLSAAIAILGPYNNVVLRGTYMTIDFTVAAAVFLLWD